MGAKTATYLAKILTIFDKKSTGCTSEDIGVNANLELVDKFCYLGDMLSVDGDADAAVETRIQTGWRQLVSVLTN